MSGSGRQIAGGIAGAIVGGFFGMPWLGFSIGSALFAPGIEGPGAPDPGDLSFNTSAYGKFMPWGYGAYKITPVTFWSTDFVAHHHSEEVGGKGGGGGATREWITYTRSFALYLRDCTDGQEITGIRRIWNKFTGELLYDVSDTASAETLIASDKMAAQIRVYTGSTTQDPDPLIEAHEGWAPAHRGHAFMVIEDFDHGESKQAVPLEVEVVAGGASLPASLLQKFSLSGSANLHKSSALYADADGVITLFKSRAALHSIGIVDVFKLLPSGQMELQTSFADPSSGTHIHGYSDVPVMLTSNNAGLVTIHDHNGIAIHQFRGAGTTHVGHDAMYYRKGDIHLLVREVFSGSTFIYSVTGPDAILVNETTTSTPTGKIHSIWIGDESIFAFTLTNQLVCYTHEWSILWSLDMSGAGISVTAGVGGNDLIIRERIDGSAVIFWSRRFWYATQGGYESLGYVSSMSNEYEEHGGHHLVGDAFLRYSASVNALDIVRLFESSGDSEPLPTVAANLCTRAGLTAAQYDTSALPATGVRQAITTQRAARDWLAELGQIFGFRMRDSAGVLEFVPKGQASVATLTAEELGFQDPPRTPAPPPISTQRNQGNDLPRAVTVSYPSADADYAPGAQPYRMHNYPQGRDVVVRTSHILSDQAAFDYAYVAAKEPHLERLSWATSLGLKRLALEPGDVVTLPNGTAWILEIHQRGATVLDLTLQSEASSAYGAPGLPAPTQSSPPVGVRLAGPTRLEILDAPAILDSHTGPGYLVAACGYLSGWDGCALYLSTDGGESYDRFMALNTAAVIGTAIDALGDGAPGALDRVNTVTVQLTHGQLASVSLANLYAGQNAAMLGDELIKFAEVEFLGNRQYRLSILQRGRKGTEWATAGHAAGDRFVLLNTALQRIPLSIDDIGAARLIKAVSYGNDIGDVSPQTFTPAGVSLLPWPPAHARAWRNGNDWEIRCKERTRFGGELRNYVGITRDPEWDGWELDIMNGAAVVRTVTGLTSPSYTYTAALQTTDFGSVQSSITYRWYQRSTVMGRGYVTQTTS